MVSPPRVSSTLCDTLGLGIREILERVQLGTVNARSSSWRVRDRRSARRLETEVPRGGLKTTGCRAWSGVLANASASHSER
jgi:hypothetical protein